MLKLIQAKLGFIVFLLVSLKVIAQEKPELISLGNMLLHEPVDPAGNETKQKIWSKSYDINLPLLVSDKFIILNKIHYNQLDAFYGNRSNNNYTHNLSLLSNRSIFIRKFNRNSIVLNFELSYGANSLSTFSFRRANYRMNVTYIKKIEFHKIESLGLGIVISTDYGATSIIPILETTVVFNPKLKINAFIPIQSKLTFLPFKNTEVGINQFTQYNTYNYETNDEFGDYSFGKSRRLGAGFYMEQKIYKRIYLMGNAGLMIRNKLMLYDHSSIKVNDLTSEPNYFINLKLSLK